MKRVLQWVSLGLLAVFVALGVLVLILPPLERPGPNPVAPAFPAFPVETVETVPGSAARPLPPLTPAPTPIAGAACAIGPVDAALANAISLRTVVWAPMRRQETGWEIYVPLIAAEIGVACGPETPGFAAALARWQAGRQLPAHGRLDELTLKTLNGIWNLRRPFVVLSARGVCPEPPPAADLAAARPEEGYARKPIQLHRGALEAYRRMVAEARAADPAIARDPEAMTLFSGFRPPAEELARCETGDCQGVTRSSCSAHRTGLAIDLVVGAAAGGRVDSSEDANRLAQSRSPAYRWMVVNAGRHGFVNYPFEPWHWEWTGAPLSQARPGPTVAAPSR